MSKTLDCDALRETRGGLWDYSNRLGRIGRHLEARRNIKFLGNRIKRFSIKDVANAGDDSVYYPGLKPLR